MKTLADDPDLTQVARSGHVPDTRSRRTMHAYLRSVAICAVCSRPVDTAQTFPSFSTHATIPLHTLDCRP